MINIEEIKARGAITAVYAEVDRLVREVSNSVATAKSAPLGKPAYHKFGNKFDEAANKLSEARGLLNEVRRLERA